jgi:hypothetical protein
MSGIGDALGKSLQTFGSTLSGSPSSGQQSSAAKPSGGSPGVLSKLFSSTGASPAVGGDIGGEGAGAADMAAAMADGDLGSDQEQPSTSHQVGQAISGATTTFANTLTGQPAAKPSAQLPSTADAQKRIGELRSKTPAPYADGEMGGAGTHPTMPRQTYVGAVPGGGGAPADADFKEPGGEAHWTLREEKDFILAKNQRTGQLMKLMTAPLSPSEKKQAMAPHGAGSLDSNDPNRKHSNMHDGDLDPSSGSADVLSPGGGLDVLGTAAQENAIASQYSRPTDWNPKQFSDGELAQPGALLRASALHELKRAYGEVHNSVPGTPQQSHVFCDIKSMIDAITEDKIRSFAGKLGQSLDDKFKKGKK